jgi:hypothetical protein
MHFCVFDLGGRIKLVILFYPDVGIGLYFQLTDKGGDSAFESSSEVSRSATSSTKPTLFL